MAKGQSKAKRNPEGLCEICGILIWNKMRSSIYCDACGKVNADVRDRKHTLTSLLRKKHPEYNLELDYKLTKKSLGG